MPNPKKRFIKIYDKHIEKIYRFIFLKVESQQIAEDLTSQVFIKLWDRLRTNHKEKKIKNLSAYLYQIARTEIANHYRQQSKFQIISTENNQIVDPKENLEENYSLRSDLIILRNCLKQLKEKEQNLIIWRYLEELSIKNIAEILGKPEGSVRVMIHRALKELKKKMEKL